MSEPTEVKYPNKHGLERGVRIIGLGPMDGLVALVDSLPLGFSDIIIEMDGHTLLSVSAVMEDAGRLEDAETFDAIEQKGIGRWRNTTFVRIKTAPSPSWIRG
jgi:hypothetical protein